MVSKVAICNLALTPFGSARVTDIDNPSTREEELCSIMLDSISEDVMAARAWTSVVKRAALAKTSNTPTFGWSSEFQLPTDPFCLRVIEVNESSPNAIPWVREGDKLLCDESAISIRYIARLTNTESYDVHLKQAIIARLSAELSYELSSDKVLSERLHERATETLNQGSIIDAKQGSARAFVSNRLLQDR